LIGLKVPVSGHHTDKGFACSGSITVQLTGSKFSNPLFDGALALTAVSIVNVSLVVRAKRVRFP
jgi:hypothetical protein